MGDIFTNCTLGVVRRTSAGYAGELGDNAMPRGVRLDAPGTLHHVMVRGIESIVCEEEPYFRELVWYIHLNPLRAGQVGSMEELGRYPWCRSSCHHEKGEKVLAAQHKGHPLII
jgi:hypothetical protein